jgi:hypothetical protein
MQEHVIVLAFVLIPTKIGTFLRPFKLLYRSQSHITSCRRASFRMESLDTQVVHGLLRLISSELHFLYLIYCSLKPPFYIPLETSRRNEYVLETKMLLHEIHDSLHDWLELG